MKTIKTISRNMIQQNMIIANKKIKFIIMIIILKITKKMNSLLNQYKKIFLKKMTYKIINKKMNKYKSNKKHHQYLISYKSNKNRIIHKINKLNKTIFL